MRIGTAIQRVVVASAIALAAGAALAQTCVSSTPDSAPDSRYQLNSNGTATDLHTGLMWMRCTLGQSWDATNGTCTGTPKSYSWQQALQAVQTLDQAGGFAGYTDWRLPNLRELMSIARYHCYDPAINLKAFPDTPSQKFWSSTPVEAAGGLEWTVDFSTAQASYIDLTTGLPIRLVRAGAFLP